MMFNLLSLSISDLANVVMGTAIAVFILRKPVGRIVGRLGLTLVKAGMRMEGKHSTDASTPNNV